MFHHLIVPVHAKYAIMDLQRIVLKSIVIEKEAVVSNGTTTYVYKNNSTYPNLFEFISEQLHKPITIVLEGAKFGPGEIIVNGDNEEAARSQLSHCVIVLQKLILNKKSNRSSF